MNRRALIPCWLLILALTLVSQWLMAGYTMDDAFISFRYARNVARGEGWVYNPGGPAVEGFSNFLWTLLLVPCFWLRVNPMLVSQTLGAACSLGILFLAWRLTFDGVENPRGGIPLLTPLLLALTGAFTYQAVTGLETQLFTLGLTLGVFFFLRFDPRSLVYSAGGFVVASLTRPEGPALFGLSLLFLLLRWRRGGVERSGVIRFALGYLLPMAAFLAWRIHTFGEWLPNTYYAKVGPPGQLIPEGADYVYGFLKTYAVAIPWLIVLLPLAWRRRRPRELYLFTLTVTYLGIVIYEGGDWMPLHRTISPILPILYVLLVQGLDHMRQGWQWLERDSGLQVNARAARWLAILWAGAAVLSLLYPSWGVIREARIRPALYEQSHVAMGRWLAQQCGPEDRIALSDIGQIGYYSDRWVIDLAGLTDRTIAHSPGPLHKKAYNPLYVLDQKPRYVVLVCSQLAGRQVIRGFETDKRLYNHPRFQAEYRLLPEASLRFKYKDEYSYWIFERVAVDRS